MRTLNLPKALATALSLLLMFSASLSFAGNNPTAGKKPSGDEDKASTEAAEPEPVRMPVLTIEPPMETDELAIIPNPTKAMFRFSYYMPGVKTLHIRLEDELGNLVHQMDIGGHEEMYNLPFKFWQFPDGVYYLEVQTDKKTYKRRIVKANYDLH